MSKRVLSKPLWLIILCIILVVVVIAWWTHSSSDSNSASQSSQDEGVAVSAMAAKQEDFPVYVSALGTVSSLATINVKPQVEGTLERIDVNEGDQVKRNQFIARIDDRTSSASLQQAEGELAQAQSALANARKNLARYQQLGISQAISRQDIDNQRNEVREDEATVRSREASVRNSRAELSYTNITSPVDGIIGIRNVDPGNLVSSSDSDPLVTITQLDPISVIFSLPEHYRRQIAERRTKGVAVKVYDSNHDQVLGNGKVSAIDSKIDSDTGTIRIRAMFDNKQTLLYPDQFVNVQVLLNVLPNAVSIPETAVQNAQDGDFVYVVTKDNKVERRKITTQATSANQVAVKQGLAAGDQVVVDGVDQLKDGAKVNVVSHTLPGDQSAASIDQSGDSSHS